jgi:formiminotetrahydrofolate cyclodeaminase
MTLIDKSVSDLLAAFRSSDPTPGGGSASALAGAIGASLVAMVARLPKARGASEKDAERLQAAGSRCDALSDELGTLVDRDSDAYDLVMAAYRRPKATDAQKTARSAAIQDALRAAIAAPLSVMRAAAAAAEQAVVVARYGNPSASSDVQVALELLGAAVRGARLNVDINLSSVKDAAYATRVREEAQALGQAAAHHANAARASLSGRD